MSSHDRVRPLLVTRHWLSSQPTARVSTRPRDQVHARDAVAVTARFRSLVGMPSSLEHGLRGKELPVAVGGAPRRPHVCGPLSRGLAVVMETFHDAHRVGGRRKATVRLAEVAVVDGQPGALRRRRVSVCCRGGDHGLDGFDRSVENLEHSRPVPSFQKHHALVEFPDRQLASHDRAGQLEKHLCQVKETKAWALSGPLALALACFRGESEIESSDDRNEKGASGVVVTLLARQGQTTRREVRRELVRIDQGEGVHKGRREVGTSDEGLVPVWASHCKTSHAALRWCARCRTCGIA